MHGTNSNILVAIAKYRISINQKIIIGLIVDLVKLTLQRVFKFNYYWSGSGAF